LPQGTLTFAVSFGPIRPLKGKTGLGQQ